VKKKAIKKYYIDKPLIASIGKKIREYRILKKLTIEELANESDVDYTQLSRMELGKVNFSISVLYKIAAALQVDPKKLQP
jgi:transcriptional regulator with XRE-family HTH domain